MFKQLEEIVLHRGWNIDDESLGGHFLSFLTDHGNDFGFSIGSADPIQNIVERANCFSEEEFVFEWLYAKRTGTNGIPGLFDLVDDAKQIKEKLENLAIEVSALREWKGEPD